MYAAQANDYRAIVEANSAVGVAKELDEILRNPYAAIYKMMAKFWKKKIFKPKVKIDRISMFAGSSGVIEKILNRNGTTAQRQMRLP